MMRRIALMLGFALALASCGGHPADVEVRSAVQADRAPVEPATVAEPTPEAVLIGSEAAPQPKNLYPGFVTTTETHPTLVAMTRADIDVYESPGDSEPMRTLPNTTILGTVTVLTGVGPPTDGWLEVMLPGRPNGSTAWIEVASVDLYTVVGRIVIDLSDRELTYYSGDAEVLTTSVAIGSARNPTPTGTYFVTDNVRISSSEGPWGPAALGLSARSETITEFNGGDGIIGIHGTNKPGSIGQAASLGCVRLHNDVITELHKMVPLGTPVEIRA